MHPFAPLSMAGMKGVSNAQFSEFLTGIRLNEEANAVHFADRDLSYLSPTGRLCLPMTTLH